MKMVEEQGKKQIDDYKSKRKTSSFTKMIIKIIINIFIKKHLMKQSRKDLMK